MSSATGENYGIKLVYESFQPGVWVYPDFSTSSIYFLGNSKKLNRTNIDVYLIPPIL